MIITKKKTLILISGINIVANSAPITIVLLIYRTKRKLIQNEQKTKKKKTGKKTKAKNKIK